MKMMMMWGENVDEDGVREGEDEWRCEEKAEDDDKVKKKIKIMMRWGRRWRWW